MVIKFQFSISVVQRLVVSCAYAEAIVRLDVTILDVNVMD